MINDPLLDIVTRRQVLIERLKAQTGKDFRNRALKRFDRAIRSVLESLDDGLLKTSVSVRELDDAIAKLEPAMRAVLSEWAEEFEKVNKDFAGESASFEHTTLTTVAERATISSVPASVAWKMANEVPIQATGQLLKSFVKHWEDSEVEAVQNIVRKGYWSGMTKSELLTAIRGTKKQGYRDGALGRFERNTDTVIRTATQHVANTSRMAMWEANDDIVIGYRIVATLDGRTSTICRSLDGKEYKLGEGPLPPFHPGCRTTTVPVLAPQYRSSMTAGTRSSKDGYVAGSTTYYEWLKGESYQFKVLALGPTRAKLFEKGGLSAAEFGRLNLGRNFEPMTLDEMRAINPTAFERAGL